jgi:hypothetical protein
MKSHDAAKGEDKFLMWTKVEFRTERQWVPLRLQSNTPAIGLNYLSVLLQSFCWIWPLFQFLNLIQSR